MTFTIRSDSFKDGDYLAKTLFCQPTSASAARATTNRRIWSGRGHPQARRALPSPASIRMLRRGAGSGLAGGKHTAERNRA